MAALAVVIVLLLVSWLVWGTPTHDAAPTAQAPTTTTAGPSSTAEPSPGATATAGQTPGPTPQPEDSPTQALEPTPAPQGVELNDAQFNAPADWQIYLDELIEDDRRLVQLRNVPTDSRFQAVTLLTADADLAASCNALVASQVQAFEAPSEQLSVPVAVDPEQGEGITCGFAGVRASDQVPNSVSFTLLRRNSDGHVLLLRQTIPDALAAGALARRQLGTMSCQASTSFGVTLPLC